MNFNCPDCSAIAQIVETEDSTPVFKVKCPRCNYSNVLGKYLGDFGRGEFGVEHLYKNKYRILKSGQEWEMEISQANKDKVEISLKMYSPNEGRYIINFLKNFFGNVLWLDILQTGIDDGFTGCPHCGGDRFERESVQDRTVSCVSCKKGKFGFAINIVQWAGSVIQTKTGFDINRIDGEHFSVTYGRKSSPQGIWKTVTWLQDIIAKMDLRFGNEKTVLAIRPTGPKELEPQILQLVAFLKESIQLDGLEVVLLNRR